MEERTKMRPQGESERAAEASFCEECEPHSPDARPSSAEGSHCKPEQEQVESEVAGDAKEEAVGFAANGEIPDENPEDGVENPEPAAGEVAEALTRIESGIAELKGLFEDRIARTEYETATMKKLSDEVQGYRDDLYRKLALPFVKDLIAMHKTAASLEASCDDAPARPSAAGMLAEMARDALEKHGVVIVDAQEGDALVPAQHRAIAKTATSDSTLHGRIASAHESLYMLAGECIAPAMVTVYFYEAVEQ